VKSFALLIHVVYQITQFHPTKRTESIFREMVSAQVTVMVMEHMLIGRMEHIEGMKVMLPRFHMLRV